MRDAADVEALLDAGTALNRYWLRTRGGLPRPFWRLGLRYQREARDAGGRREDWQLWPELLASRRGDCEDLAMGYASLRRDRRCIVREVPEGYHILVEDLATGRVLDVSLRLGM